METSPTPTVIIKHLYRKVTGLIWRLWPSRDKRDIPADVVLAAASLALRRAVDPAANFFDQGGDSLAAIEFMAEVKRGADVEIPFTVLITDSVQEVASFVEKASGKNSSSGAK